MKLGSLQDGSRDGRLVLVDRDLGYYQAVRSCKTMQALLDDWDRFRGDIELQWQSFVADPKLESDRLDQSVLLSPLPRAYEWIDGSAFINHVLLVRKARKADPPATLKTDPLVYQGGSGVLLAPRGPIHLQDESWGCDFESEVCVILGDTPQGTKSKDAEKYIRLVMIANDVSLRNLIPEELNKGFGFFCSKPATAFGPVAITPDELGAHWKGGRVHRPLVTKLNGEVFGDPDAGSEMHFSFFDLIEHITKTRSFTAGTILGSGTVSNEDRRRGSSCLAEKRMLEVIDTGTATTPFLKYGDRVEIEMFGDDGSSYFGRIDQKVRR
jgi:fumarylacetoacetate (FAA) hydrolase